MDNTLGTTGQTTPEKGACGSSNLSGYLPFTCLLLSVHVAEDLTASHCWAPELIPDIHGCLKRQPGGLGATK